MPNTDQFRATYRQIEAFVAVIEEGSFARAAAALSVSSAAVSKHIAALEEGIQCRLFARENGTLARLTAHGALLSTTAPKLLQDLAAFSAIAAPKRPEVRTIRVFAGEYLVNMFLLPALSEFNRLHPGIEVQFMDVGRNWQRQLQPIPEGFDLGYTSSLHAIQGPDCEFLGVGGSGIYISPDHPMANQTSWTEADPLPVIMPLRGGNREQMQSTIIAASIGSRNFYAAARAQHVETAEQLAIDGVGACFLLDERGQQLAEAGRLRQLQVKTPPLLRYALWRHDALASPPIRKFHEFALARLRLPRILPVA